MGYLASNPTYVPSYNQQALDKFVSEAKKKGTQKIEVIVATYAKPLVLKNKKEFHHNILIKSGRKKVSLYDLISLNDPEENEPIAFNEAAQAAKQVEKWGVNAIWHKKEVKYSWFFDEIILD